MPVAVERLRDAMDDDFNTPEALAVHARSGAELNFGQGGRKRCRSVGSGAATLWALGAIFGVLQQDADEVFERKRRR